MTEMISFWVNGNYISTQVAANQTLLHLLRDQLQLTGTKNGCSQGDCGACTVLVDGQPVKSCQVLARRVQGCRVETIEGLERDDKLHPLQQAFIDEGGVQCGFCTPGMILSAKALLDRNPKPSVAEIMTALKGNLCRCTGYVRIIRAVQRAAAVLRGEAPVGVNLRQDDSLIGVSLPDVDGRERVTGTLQFADDLDFPGMLHGRLLLASYPCARINSIDVSAARTMPGVHAVLTAQDVPGSNRFGINIPDQTVMATGRVRYTGEVVAVVFAETASQAAQAVRAIQVDYQPEKGLYSPQEAIQPGAPQLHPGGNLLKQSELRRGDVEQGFAAADVVVEETYYTPFLDHAFIEPEAGVAVPGADGCLTIYYPGQMPFRTRQLVAENLAIPEEQIRVISTPAGGAFGGKADITIEIILALGAMRIGRPVKITLTRAESLRMHTKRHAFYMRYRTGATRDGRLTALEAEVVADSGAYASVTPGVLEQALVFCGGPYNWPNIKVDGYAVYTNNVVGGAFRGFGINQVAFAVESQLDSMAHQLQIDPIEFRLRNALDVGSETVTGEILRHNVAVMSTLLLARELLAQHPPAPAAPGTKVGVGVASGYKNIGSGRGFFNHGGASFALLPGGQVQVCASAIDMGQGVRTVLVQLAAESTGIDHRQIRLITGDTSVMPPGAGALGQRQTFITGNAVLLAGRQFRQRLLEAAALLLGTGATELEVQADSITARATGQLLLTLAELERRFHEQGEALQTTYQYVPPRTYPLKDDPNPLFPVIENGKIVTDYDPEDYRNYFAYNYVTQVAEVEVDEASGQVRLRRLLAVHDVGKALNPDKILGQLESSCVMGLGYALSEEFVVQEGVNLTKTLAQCGIPTIAQTPEVVIALVEDPVAEGPFGAKGVSEVALVPTAPAITNAIYNAVRVRITSLPVKDQLAGLLQPANDQNKQG